MVPRLFLVTTVSLLALTGCKEKVSPAETAAHLKAAQDLYARKDYTHALVEVQGAIKGDPRSGEAHYLAAQIQEGLGNQKAAFEEYARAAVPDANSLKAQLKVAQILIEAKQVDAAMGRINGTLGAHPNDPDALALRALAAQRQGNADKARADAQAALGRAPGQPVATAVLATDALASKNTAKALELVEAGLKAHPDDGVLIRLKAAALLVTDKKDDAISIYQGLVAGEPTSARNRMALSELEAQAGRIDDGERILREGVGAAPDSAEMRVALVGYLARHRGPEAADTALQEAIAARPQESGFDMMRAEQAMRLGQPDQAAAALDAAVTRLPDGPARQTAQIGLARLKIDQGDIAAARTLLEAVLKTKADNDDALLLRATLALRAGEAAQAVPDLLAVAGRQPRNSIPFALLADAYAQQGDFGKATDALRKVIYFEPANLEAAKRLADMQVKAGKPDLAKAALADFVTRNPDNLDGRLAVIRFAEQGKDWAGAQAALDAMRRLPKADRAVALLAAEVMEAKGQPDLAMAAYAKQLDVLPGRPFDRNALQGYVRSAAAAKQIAPAIATVSALAGRLTGGDAAVANVVLSALYRTDDQPDKALAAASAAIVAAPKEPVGYLETAGLQQKTQPTAAIATLDQGLSAGAPVEPLLLARATLQDQVGDKDAAIANYRDVLKLNPRSLVAANNYGSLVADARPSDTALLKEARQPLQRFADGSNPAVLDTIAWLDYRLGDYPSAKALLLRAGAETSPNPQIRYHYGAVLIALGQRVAGRSAVKAALVAPFPGREEAERLLTE